MFRVLRFIIPVLCLGLAFLGCSGNERPEPTQADLEAEAAGVGKESQVRFYLTEQLELSSLDLTHTGNGNFTGKGVRGNGVEYEIDVVQEPGAIKFTWENSKGKRGKGSFSY